MRKFEQVAFTEPESPDEDTILFVHSNSPDNSKLIIFVHGLGGSVYGKNSTWGKFPQYFFEDIKNCDVGMYQYRTLIKRLGFSKSIRFEDEAMVFADTIRDELASYQSIVLIGHSMGGLLCKAAIVSLQGNWNHSVIH